MHATARLWADGRSNYSRLCSAELPLQYARGSEAFLATNNGVTDRRLSEASTRRAFVRLWQAVFFRLEVAGQARLLHRHLQLNLGYCLHGVANSPKSLWRAHGTKVRNSQENSSKSAQSRMS